MKTTRILLLLLMLLAQQALLRAQDTKYLTGKLVDAKSSDQVVYYDRTQYPLTGTTFRSVYKVFDVNKILLYTINLTHEQSKSTFTFSLKREGENAKDVVVKYDKKKCGLIFSDVSNTDSFYNITKPYNYIVSFTDAKRDYPILHKIKTARGEQLMMDPITKLRTEKHNEALAKIPGFERAKTPNYVFVPETTEVHVFLGQMEAAKKELYKKDANYHDTVEFIRRKIDLELNNMFNGGKVNYNKRKYDGAKTKGEPNGRGILVDKGIVYSGTFKDGAFVTGRGIYKNENFEYCGEFVNGKYHGAGFIKFANGSYLVGRFSNGVLANGVTLAKNQDGEVYFGFIQNGQKTGYGELKDVRGDVYYGNFLNGRLEKGYCKETDKFGFVTYSRIEGATKSTNVSPLAKDFFATIPQFRN